MARNKHTPKRTKKTRETRSRNWKLPIVTLPNSAFTKRDKDLARLNNRLHRAIRRFLLKTKGPKCSACGFTPANPRQLAAHEVFELDERKHLMRFIRYRLLCRDCHYLTHHGYWGMLKYTHYKEHPEHFISTNDSLNYLQRSKQLTELFCKVNGCTIEEAIKHARASLRRGGGILYHTDWSALRQFQGKLGTNDSTLFKFLASSQL